MRELALHFVAETHRRAIPILQFARLAVGNVALQGRSAAGWRALGSMSRRSSSPTLRPGDIVIMDNLGSHIAKGCASSSAQPGPNSSSCRNTRRT